MNLSQALTDPQMAEFFLVLRSQGQFAAGGWTDTKTEIKFRGIIRIAQAEDLSMTEDADVVLGAIVIESGQKIYRTHADGQTAGVSDIVVWNGEKYRVFSVAPYPNRGFWKALAARMLAD
jgi:hypothetical protein